ncbi:hypothetical protein ACXIVK_18980 [Paraburkholderia caledonica]
MDNKNLFSRIERMVKHIDNYRNGENFEKEHKRRLALRPKPLVTDNEVLRNLALIVAFAHADSGRVKAMIDGGRWDFVWLNYDVHAVAELNPCDVIGEHWNAISPIMNGAKAYFIVMAARALRRLALENGSSGFDSLLNKSGIPHRIQEEDHINAFWEAFKRLRLQMKEHGIPYLGSITSLSHLLLHLGYDCIKPDVIVMQVAKKLGMVEDTKKDSSLQKVARLLQQYAYSRQIRPSEIDMYFLIQGQQSEARAWVRPDFLPFEETDNSSGPVLPQAA